MHVDQPLTARSAPPLLPQRRNEAEQTLVIIVDDHASVREALSELILSAGFQAACFASTREFLDADLLDTPGCMILDVRMPGASGLDLQQHLAQSGNLKPIIFLTGHGDIPMTVQAMKAGAVDSSPSRCGIRRCSTPCSRALRWMRRSAPGPGSRGSMSTATRA